MKKLKVRKICGFKEIDNTQFLLVVWEDKKCTWEPTTNLNCPNLIKRFLSKSFDTVDTNIETKKEENEKREEREMIMRLKKLKSENEAKRETEEKRKPDFDDLVSRHGIKSFIRKDQNVFGNKKIGTMNELISKTSFLNTRREKFQQNKIEQKPYPSQESSISERPSFSQPRRYFETEMKKPLQKTTHLPKQSINLGVKKFYGKREIVNLNVLGIAKSTCFLKRQIETFQFDPDDLNLNFKIKLDNLMLILFSLRQKTRKIFYNLHELQIVDNDESFAKLNVLFTSERIAVYSKSSEEFLNFVVFNANESKEFDLKYKLNLLQIKKSYIPEFCRFEKFAVPRELSCLKFERLNWIDQIENREIFNTSSLGLKSVFKFGIFGNSASRLSLEFLTTLRQKGGTFCSIIDDSLDYIFIAEDCLQFLHLLPGLHEKLEKGVLFYKFGFSTSKNAPVFIEKIFVEGGVFTLTKNILESPDECPGLMHIFNLAEKNPNKWMIRIPKSALINFEKILNKKFDTVQYAGLLAIYNMLKNSVENFNTATIEDYLHCLKEKYYNSKRFFFIVNSECFGSDVKTPNEISKIIKA